MKNKIAKDRRSDVSNENIEENQQAIKFFKTLSSKKSYNDVRAVCEI